MSDDDRPAEILLRQEGRAVWAECTASGCVWTSDKKWFYHGSYLLAIAQAAAVEDWKRHTKYEHMSRMTQQTWRVLDSGLIEVELSDHVGDVTKRIIEDTSNPCVVAVLDAMSDWMADRMKRGVV